MPSSSSFARAQREYENRTPPEPVWEGQIDVVCGSEVHRKLITPDMERQLVRLSSSRIDDFVVTQVVNAWRRAESVTVLCTFEGEVDAYRMTKEGPTHWECPACGEEREED